MPVKRIISLHDVSVFLYLIPLRIAAIVLPLNIIRPAGRLLARIYSSLYTGRRKRIREKLTLIVGSSRTREEIDALSHESMRMAVSAYIDALFAERIATHDLLGCGRVRGWENLESALSAKKGVILVSGHFCADMVASRFLRETGLPLLSVIKSKSFAPEKSLVENRYLRPYWSRVFNQSREGNIFIEDPGSGLRIMKHLRENGVVHVKLDVPFSGRLKESSFFGARRLFPINFLKIAFLTGSPVVPMVCAGNSASFEIVFEKIPELHEVGDMDGFIRMNLDALVRVLESQIRRHPSHWLFIERKGTQVSGNKAREAPGNDAGYTGATPSGKVGEQI